MIRCGVLWHLIWVFSLLQSEYGNMIKLMPLRNTPGSAPVSGALDQPYMYHVHSLTGSLLGTLWLTKDSSFI